MSALTDELHAQWRKNGWLHLPQALGRSARMSLDRWSSEIEEWSLRQIRQRDVGVVSDDGLHTVAVTEDGCRLLSSADFAHRNGISAFLKKGLVVDVIDELFGQRPLLLTEEITYEHPGHGTPPHQDVWAHPMVDHHITCLVPLDPITFDNGPLYVAPVEAGRRLPDHDGQIDQAWVEQADWTTVACSPGDVLFLDSFTPHYTAPNSGSHTRRILNVAYNRRSDGNHRAAYFDEQRALQAEALAIEVG